MMGNLCYNYFRTLMIASVVCGASLVAPACYADDPPVTDASIGWKHYEDPSIVERYSKLVWPSDVQQPWLRSLESNESDLRREAADTITVAVRYGLEPLPELEKALLAVAVSSKELLEARMSAVNALLACNFRDSAAELAALVEQVPFAMRVLIESGLVNWGYPPMASVWQARLEQPGSDGQLFMLAAAGVAQVSHPEAIPSLQRIALGKIHPTTRRLAAAAAWAKICESSGVGVDELTSASQRLLETAGSERAVELLVGVRLAGVSGPQSDQAGNVTSLLERYADQAWNVVKGEALRRLLVLKPEAVLVRSQANIHHPDANVRRITIDALVLEKNQQNLTLLVSALDDPVPDNRQAARDHLLTYTADANWKASVIAEATGVLESDSWRSIEQALIILTRLDHRAATGRAFELVDHARAEVFVTAAWSLKMLADESWGPEVFRLYTDKFKQLEEAPELQLAYAVCHLIEGLGMLRFREALPSFRKFFPKGAPFLIRMRCAAIWASGYLVTPGEESDIPDLFEERFMDFASIPPEELEVRMAAAIALGRMQAKSALPSLQSRAAVEGRGSLVGSRAHWAVSEITGEPMPGVPTLTQTLGGWSLQAAPAIAQ